MNFPFLQQKKEPKMVPKTDLKLTPVKEKMLIKVQQDINRQALIKLLDLEASVIDRRSDDLYNSRNTSLGAN